MMNSLYILLFFALRFQSFAQQEYFNFTDTVFKTGAIKRIPYMYHLCGDGIDEAGEVTMDSVAAFLNKHKSIVIELGVYYATRKTDLEEAEYFKSLLITRGVDAAQIHIKGYSGKDVLYSRKMIKQFYMYRYSPGGYVAENMSTLNNRVELKIVQL